MKEQVLNLFLEKKLKVQEISKELKISKEEILTILEQEHYLVSGNRSFDTVICIKEAIDYYISHSDISATKVAKLYNLSPTTLCLCLKKIGHQAINNQNRTKFNEHVFDVIDTEEKAYWLGFIFADGNISSVEENKKVRYQFEVSLSDVDHNHLTKFNAFMQHEKDNVITSEVKLNGKIFKRCRWIINNKHLWNTLNNLSCVPNKSLSLIFRLFSSFNLLDSIS